MLNRLFEPESIAVVGASNSSDKPGNNIVQSLSNFPGKVFPVNPRDSEVCGIKAYPSLNDIDDAIDLVIFAIPAKAVISTLREATIDICGCLIVSSGFEETGGETAKRSTTAHWSKP